MAQMWFGSLVPWLDPNGDPYVGAVVEFFDAGTGTPQTVYTDAALGLAAGEDLRTADAAGRWRALFLNPTPGSYRCKGTAADGTVIFDVDDISVPQNADYVPPDTGDTSITLLARTGFMWPYYGTSAPSGWVRGNGRTIGSATSGATERANADCSDLFQHLWTQDGTLAVSGGRGGTASGDWAANKNIALPDFRGRTFVGLDTMGSTAAGVLTGIDTVGETVGAQTVALTTAQLASHTHVIQSGGAHQHHYTGPESLASRPAAGGGNPPMMLGDDDDNLLTKSGDGAHTHTIDSAGSGEAHPNVQPSKGVTIMIKL